MVAFIVVYFSGMAAETLFSFTGRFTSGIQAGNYYFWLSGLEPTVAETDTNRASGPPDNCRTYELKDLQFLYPLAPDRKVLNGISMEIQRGDFVAFIGASGCRKSTMISLLERLYDPASGTISIDSHSLTSFSPRQRIAIFRALIRQSSVILLGEATSALDTESERIVRAALTEAATGNSITIVVAHRLSTIRPANRIFVLYGGRVVEA
ncbi:uncharacterized protein TRIVIDRAFT_201715 [Trichoderma virens Gv29-8]|uniref:AAA+ ATPase domain-containing protein n=1 Tax=Hypocrea virens (strain Gv29-8 / FGSC 10586) TaxID=413071 RepID=G9MUV3_HYPVG|nr:uncharacterized protein TRIVIDRAFT_201715 [Trichoderma virens Gv29-8]EHK21768.1 hypothetical protein TRIVIDRAFT_201715 [Trichoderma virens Gv29-8]